MRFIGRGYIGLQRYDEAEMWLTKAIEETPYIREPYIELGALYYDLKKYEEGIKYLEQGINIKDKSSDYINEDFAWNETPYDLLSLCYYNIGEYQKSLEISINSLNRIEPGIYDKLLNLYGEER